jgi:hypothetical protein
VGERAALAVPGFAAVTLALAGVWLAVAAALNLRLRAQAKASGRSSGL